MPELPDVEFARRQLERWLGGATITSVRSTDRRILRPASPEAFARALVGQKVSGIQRHGKWLRILLADGARVFSHLGMTGAWVERPRESPEAKAERARIDVVRRGQSRSVRYVDPRRFGRLVVSDDDIPEWLALGPDPLVDGVRAGRLVEALGGSRRPIKDVLMDQTILAGIGNILATEALWYARLDPQSPSDALSRADIGRLARGLGTALRRALAVREPAGEDGWEEVFRVYGREDAPCPRCGAPLRRTVLAGRTTTFCERCQERRKSPGSRGAPSRR